ncbi:POTRA domain-containing protein [Tamlana crocina]|nr:POTRA domain-containing protein [Tamlana crocina]
MKGANSDETKTVDSLNYQKRHIDFKSLTAEVNTTQQTLYKLGYIENEAYPIKKVNDSTFSVKIALKRKFNSIQIYYDNTTLAPSMLKSFSKRITNDYFEIPFHQIEAILGGINQDISEKGLPFSKLRLSEIEVKNNRTLHAQLVVDSNQKPRTIDDITIRGYEKFPRSFLKHYLKIKPGQVFYLSTIKRKTEQLANLNFAEQLKSPEVLFSKDSTILYVYTKKTNSNAFDGFLGFGTNEDSNKLEFDGYLNLNLTNNLNFGESFRLLYKSDENDQKTFESNITMPYIFNSPIGIELALRIFKKDSSFTTTNQTAKINYQINPKHRIALGITSSESSYLQSTTSLTLRDYNSNFFTISHQYNNLQASNLLFPVKSHFNIEIGTGKRKTESDSEKQTLLTLNASNIFNLNAKNSIYLRTTGSYLQSDNYFKNELFRFGGINSIRGFEENSLFASLFGIINTEYRYQLANTVYIHTIFDAAYFDNKITSVQQKLFGFGFGFGLLTKAGLFKLNYANGKNENSNFKLSDSKVHLSLTAYF